MSKSIRIILTGASGVGKSTLVEKFIKEHPEYYRPPSFSRPMNLMLGFPLNEDATHESQYATTAFMSHQILTHNNLIYDRGIIDCLAYTNLSKNISKSQYKKHKMDFMPIFEKVDILHLYIPIEFDMKDDGIRSKDEKYRRKTDKFMKKFLDKNNIFYETLTGTVDERYEQMLNAIEAQQIF